MKMFSTQTGEWIDEPIAETDFLDELPFNNVCLIFYDKYLEYRSQGLSEQEMATKLGCKSVAKFRHMVDRAKRRINKINHSGLT